ncbi:MAG: tRNA methyltransferase ppm2 [Chrysothrix sp. TS-e1954]|nr:MAG: tRNA methyltransferase ppm2 [Chrysothrix sp. TS-e1954]
MLKHFVKLKSPLNSAVIYPTLKDQVGRFNDTGWTHANARSLWDLWSDDGFIAPDERHELDHVEPFDEWEEFAMFASHYFILIASQDLDGEVIHPSPRISANEHTEDATIPKLDLVPQIEKGITPRRHGSSFTIDSDNVLCFAGHGVQGRLSTTDQLTSSATETSTIDTLSIPPVTGVVCNTTTRFQQNDHLVVGGRRSPDDAQRGCFHRSQGRWHRVEDLPKGLYRHTATKVHCGGCEGILIHGGKHSSTEISDDWLFWQPGASWRKLRVRGELPDSVFGASMIATDANSGLMLGGINSQNVVNMKIWRWDVKSDQGDEGVYVHCDQIDPTIPNGALQMAAVARFGAQIVSLGSKILLVGGICADGITRLQDEILQIDASSATIGRVRKENVSQRPLLIGVSIEKLEEDRCLIIGGGAVCFSFGTFWNTCCFLCGMKIDSHDKKWTLRHVHGQKYTKSRHLPTVDDVPNTRSTSIRALADCETVEVPRCTIASKKDFESVLRAGKPVILEQLDIGPCAHLWSLDYLRAKVVIHASRSTQMDFVKKNFEYQHIRFGDFLDALERNEAVYLRAISSSNPTTQATSLDKDFPKLAGDFDLPPELADVTDNLHSSPLRISGPARMWLHYDVMANVLAQIRSSKELILYHPSDVDQLGFAPGASSSTLDVCDTAKHKFKPHTKRYKASVSAGDVLFIPALWSHAAAPTDGFSVAVNVFFRNLTTGYAAGKDVYGNRDLQAYENGRQNVQRMANAFKDVPAEARTFYLKRLAQELMDLAE